MAIHDLMMPRGKWLSWICFNTNANSRTQFTNGNNQILYDFVFISVKHYCTTVKQRKKKQPTFYKITFTYVNQCWHFNKPSDCTELIFQSETKLAWEMNVDWKGNVFVQRLHWIDYSQMYYNALFCMTIFRLDWTVSHVNWILFFRSFI